MTTPYVLPVILHGENLDLAAEHVRNYTERWDGAHFETFGTNDTNRITSDDIVAVSMLSVFVPARAARDIIDKDAEKIEGYLREIPINVSLTDPEGTALTAKKSEATRLWNLLRSMPDVGPTIASKLMARKRPALIPVQDGVVRAAVGWTKGSDFWVGMRDLIGTADGGAIPKRLQRIRDAAGAAGRYSDLRTFDIAVWMASRDDARTD